MEQLIKTIINPGNQEVVSAISLHGYLKIATRFDIWFARMVEYGFNEGTDYERLYNNVRSNIQPNLFNQVLSDAAITFDMAKHLAMIQRTPEGMKARNWFIEREKTATKLEQVIKLPDFTNPVIAARAWADEREQRELAEAKNNELAPKAEVYDQISNCTNLKSIGTVAKELGTGVKRLFHFMRSAKIIMPSPSTIPYQQYLDSGYFKVRTVPIKQLGKNQATSYFTAKGEIWITEKYNKRNPIINVVPEIINQNN